VRLERKKKNCSVWLGKDIEKMTWLSKKYRNKKTTRGVGLKGWGRNGAKVTQGGGVKSRDFNQRGGEEGLSYRKSR